jgi:septal ring-binding cell division protein DamX
MARGDLERAVRQGERRLRDIPSTHFTLRLEIACQGETIRRVTQMFKGARPDLYLLPMALRDGRGCFQVMLGDYPTRTTAEKAVRRLPASFRADRNPPKPFRVSELSRKQQ